jgi:hypothetical protein
MEDETTITEEYGPEELCSVRDVVEGATSSDDVELLLYFLSDCIFYLNPYHQLLVLIPY